MHCRRAAIFTCIRVSGGTRFTDAVSVQVAMTRVRGSNGCYHRIQRKADSYIGLKRYTDVDSEKVWKKAHDAREE